MRCFNDLETYCIGIGIQSFGSCGRGRGEVEQSRRSGGACCLVDGSVPDGRWMTAFWPQESLAGVDKLI